MLLLAIVIALSVVAVILFVVMFRRDDPMLGLLGLAVTLAAALAAVFYGGLESL